MKRICKYQIMEGKQRLPGMSFVFCNQLNYLKLAQKVFKKESADERLNKEDTIETWLKSTEDRKKAMWAL